MHRDFDQQALATRESSHRQASALSKEADLKESFDAI